MELPELHLFPILAKWQQAISDPIQLLPTSPPTDVQISDGLDFILAMVAAYAILAAQLALRHRGEVGERLVGLLSTAIIVMAWHFPFVLMGGTANFSATYLAYCYGAGPYLPLTAFAMVIFAAGLPSGTLRQFRDPKNAKPALEAAMKHPETSKGIIVLGCAGFSLISLWGLFVTFNCLGFVHRLSGWRLAVAILLSMIVAYPIHKIFLRIGRLSAP